MIGLYFFNNNLGHKAYRITVSNIKEMLLFLPAIFILVGLLDVWVPKETIIKLMGEQSGIKGFVIVLLLATVAAGPLYVAFPIATMLLKKGARLAHILFFLGAWTSTKLPIALYEIASLGLKFTLLHIAISIPAFLLIAFIIEKIVPKDSLNMIHEK